MQIVLALALLAVGGAAAIAIRVQAAGGTIEHFDALSSLHDALVGVFVVLPLWFGLATVVVPLQIGASKLAFPEVVGGGAMALRRRRGDGAGRLHEHPRPVRVPHRFLAGPLPASLADAVNTKGDDLIVLGMLLGAIATALMAVNLVATIASRARPRPHDRSPAVLLVVGPRRWHRRSHRVARCSSPGSRSSGSTSTSAATSSRRARRRAFWMHAVWLGGRPEALLGSVFVLGAGSDIVATATGRTNELDVVTRAAIAAYATLAFVVWTLGPGDLRVDHGALRKRRRRRYRFSLALSSFSVGWPSSATAQKRCPRSRRS